MAEYGFKWLLVIGVNVWFCTDLFDYQLGLYYLKRVLETSVLLKSYLHIDCDYCMRLDCLDLYTDCLKSYHNMVK